MTPLMRQMKNAAAVLENQRERFMRSNPTEYFKQLDEGAILTRVTKTVHGHEIEVMATTGGNSRAQHKRFNWKIDGKRAAAAKVEHLLLTGNLKEA